MYQYTYTVEVESVSFDVTGETDRQLTIEPVDGESVEFEYIEPQNSLASAGMVDPENVDSYPTLTFDVASELVAEHMFSDLYEVTIVSDTDAVPDIEVWARGSTMSDVFPVDLYGSSTKV